MLRAKYIKTLRNLVGLDINASRLNLIEYRRQTNSLRFNHAQSIALQAGTIVNEQIGQAAQLSDAIKYALDKLQPHSRELAIGLNHSHIITKTIPFDAELLDTEIAIQLALNAKKLLGFSAHELQFDFNRIGKNKNLVNHDNIWVAAAHKQRLEQMVLAIEAAQCTVKIVDLKSQALLRGLLYLSEQNELNTQGVVLILAFQANVLTLYFYQQHILIECYELNLATLLSSSEDLLLQQILKSIKQHCELVCAMQSEKNIQYCMILDEWHSTTNIIKRVNLELDIPTKIITLKAHLFSKAIPLPNWQHFILAAGLALWGHQHV